VAVVLRLAQRVADRGDLAAVSSLREAISRPITEQISPNDAVFSL